MRNRSPLPLVGLLAILFSSHGATSEKQAKPLPSILDIATETPPPIELSSTAADTFLLGTWDFDDGAGGPDPQGWASVDLHEQETFFHVDDFAGLLGYAPLEGAKSMWCGARSTDPRTSYFLSLPGYGSSWSQVFESTVFATTGDVTISYLISHDSEAGFDGTTVQYLSESSVWRDLAFFDGVGQSSQSHTVPEDSLNGQAQFRFRFESDPSYDDKDSLYVSNGAVVLDSIVVSDTTGVVDSQNFETEAVGDLATADGDWTASAPGFTPFGDFGGLFDGTMVLQEDSLVTNNTYFWGFFNGSTDDYDCGGHPEQIAVQSGPPGECVGEPHEFIYNAIWSPPLSFTQDANTIPIPVGAVTVLEFDVYRDLPLTSLNFYLVAARSKVGGFWGPWILNPGVHFGAQKDWFRFEAAINGIDTDATDIQIRIELQDADWDPLACGIYADGCHSHSPLIDNVKITRVDTTTATGLPDDPTMPRTFALHQNWPNPFNPTTTISYDVPAGGGRVDIAVYDVAGKQIRQLVSGVQTAGQKTATWNGRNEQGRVVATGVYFYRLVAGDFSITRKMLLLK